MSKIFFAELFYSAKKVEVLLPEINFLKFIRLSNIRNGDKEK
jgi:hypothetical protein